jgi:hypothetical protein
MTRLVIAPPSGSINTPTGFTLENPEVPIYDNPYGQPEPTFGPDVDVREITLILNNGGLKIDLRGYFETVVVNESMFNMKIHGFIILNDSVGALEKFEIRGGETLGMKIYKPESEDILIWREDFIINKVNKHEVDAMTGNAKYQLMFTSNTFVRSIKKTIFKSYKNVPLIDAVKSLYGEMSSNDLMYEDPQVTLNDAYICTGLHPHKAIDFLTQRASGPLKFFVFYERFVPVTGQYINGRPFAGSHYFGSIESLIDSAGTSGIKTIVFGPKTNANQEDGNTIRATKFVKEANFNQLESALLGLNRTQFTYLNLTNRTSETSAISYSDPDFFTEVSKDLYSTSFLDTKNRFFMDQDVNPTEIGNRKVTTLNSFGNKTKDGWLPYNIFGMLTKNLFKVGVIVQGGTNAISVGNIVQFNVISYFERMMNASSGSPPLDEIYSGRYYVTGVTHAITQEKYQKTLELSRGSSRKDFLSENLLIDKLKTTYPNLANLFTR